jgi:hypothetical protein
MRILKSFLVLTVFVALVGFGSQANAALFNMKVTDNLKEAVEVSTLMNSVVHMTNSQHGFVTVRLMKDGPYLNGVKAKFENLIADKDGRKALLRTFRHKDLNSLDAARFVITLYDSLEEIPSNVVMFLNNVLEVEDLKGLLSDLLVLASENLKDAIDVRSKWSDIFNNTLPNGGLAQAIADARSSIENNIFAQVGSVRDALDNLDITLEGDFGENFQQVRDDLSDARLAIQNDISTYSGILKTNLDDVRNDVATTTGSIRNRLEEVNSSLNLTLGDHGAILNTVKSNTGTILSRNDSILNITSKIDGNVLGVEANVGSVSEMLDTIHGRVLNIQSKDRARDASDLYSDLNVGDILSGAIKTIETPSIISNLPDGVIVDAIEGIIEIPENFQGDRISVTITPPENIGARVEDWVTGVDALDTALNIDRPQIVGDSYTVDVDLPSASELRDSIENNLLLLAGSEDSEIGGIKFTPTSNDKAWKVRVRR